MSGIAGSCLTRWVPLDILVNNAGRRQEQAHEVQTKNAGWPGWKSRVSQLNPIHNGGGWNEENPSSWDGFSVAFLNWDGEPALGMRWNGEEGGSVGVPQSRGLPTWFIIPGPFANAIVNIVNEHNKGKETATKPPRVQLLDFIQYIRTASDDELAKLIDDMDLRRPKAA